MSDKEEQAEQNPSPEPKEEPKVKGKKGKLSQEELQQLQKRFRKLQESRPSQRAAGASPPPAWLIHLVIWSIALVGILILVLIENKPSFIRPKPVKPFEFADPIGAGAKVPIGCAEVRKAEYANVKGFKDKFAATALDTQKKEIERTKFPLEIENSIGMRFRFVPAGTFVMGSPETEKGRNPVEVEHVEDIRRPFYLGKYEVTQEQFGKIMNFNPSQGGKNARSPLHPVQEVTWNDARKFCRLLSEKEGLPIGTYRLPLEKEWEYACRAGTQTPFYFGSDYDRLEEFAVVSTGRPEIVGQRRPNAWGLHNMHGNVWEWCQNKFYMYKSKKSHKFKRAIRGGCWRTTPDKSRSAQRFSLSETSHGNILGFRVLRIITPKTIRVVEADELKESQSEEPKPNED